MVQAILDILMKWAIPFVCTSVASAAIAYYKASRKKDAEKEEEFNKRIEAIEVGIQCLLRAEVIETSKAYIAKGWCSETELEYLDRAFDAYSNLDGNDVAEAFYEAARGLPHIEPKA